MRIFNVQTISFYDMILNMSDIIKLGDLIIVENILDKNTKYETIHVVVNVFEHISSYGIAYYAINLFPVTKYDTLGSNCAIVSTFYHRDYCSLSKNTCVCFQKKSNFLLNCRWICD